MWDKLLGLNLFPAEVARKEWRSISRKQNRYGLPLDNRRDYTKLDWMVWTATLAENRGDFEKLVAPAYRFANESPSRVPLTDWYDTVTGKQQGFQARSVVGGLFMKMLADPAIWKKWAGPRGNQRADKPFCYSLTKPMSRKIMSLLCLVLRAPVRARSPRNALTSTWFTRSRLRGCRTPV